MALHDGHRNRMRKRIEHSGIESLQDHEILEYLLYAVVPRKDTNELAHKIIAECGSLNSVFDQSIERLQQINGITYNVAVFLSSLSGVSRRYYNNMRSTDSIETVDGCLKIMKPILDTLPHEEIHLLLGDIRGKLIKRVKVSKGVVNECVCNIRDIADIALRHNATRVVIVHNHPSNVCTPSISDMIMTEQIFLALTAIGIKLDDHIIVSKDYHFSFRQNGIITRMSNGAVTFEDGKFNRISYV